MIEDEAGARAYAAWAGPDVAARRPWDSLEPAQVAGFRAFAVAAAHGQPPWPAFRTYVGVLERETKSTFLDSDWAYSWQQIAWDRAHAAVAPAGPHDGPGPEPVR